MTKSTTWAHLPNAQHIDRILAHLKTHPEKWNTTRDVIWDAAWSNAWFNTQNAKRDVVRSEVWDAARGVVPYKVWDAAWSPIRGALLALIAYDDCAYILSLPTGAVRVMISAGNLHAVLLYSAISAMNEEKIQ